jgi:actin-related protein 10
VFLALSYPFVHSYFTITTKIDLPGFSHSALKTGGEEILRERWDEAQSRAPDPGDTTSPAVVTPLGKKIGMALPDWTRAPLMVGAPMAGVRRPVDPRAPTAQQEPVGA